MSKIWKWILGILLILVIVAGVAALGFVWQSHRMAVTSYRPPFGRESNGPMMQRGNDGWGQPPMGRHFDGGPHSMMGGYPPFFGGLFLLGGLLKLAIFIGLLYGAYALGRRNARITLDPKPAAPVAEVPAPEAETPPAPRTRQKKTG
jgi:hypothetical protein